MHRRTFLGVAAATAVSGCAGDVGALDARSSRHPDYPMTQRLRGGFDRIAFQDNGDALVHFAPDHGFDGVLVYNSADDDPFEDSLTACAAPRYEGPIRMGVVAAIASADVQFPGQRFVLQGADGSLFQSCGGHGTIPFPAQIDTLRGTAEFLLPASVAPSNVPTGDG